MLVMVLIKKTVLCIVAFLLVMAASCAAPAKAAVFSDVSSDEWYAADVNFVVLLGLMNGTGSNMFSPSAKMTRAMFVTMLGRYANADNSSGIVAGRITDTNVNMRSQPNTSSAVIDLLSIGTNVDVLGLSGGWYNIKYDGSVGYVRADLMSAFEPGFADVAYGTYYSAYVRWAHASGVLDGMIEASPPMTFLPDRYITREEICTLLYNYCGIMGIVLPGITEKTEFTDGAIISRYAADAVCAMQQAGVVEGYADGSFVPHGDASRAEVAAIMRRFVTTVSSITPGRRGLLIAYAGYQLSGNIVPETSAVPDSYFADACFIGHSLVVGMNNNSLFAGAGYFAVSGISAGGLLTYSQFPLTSTGGGDAGGDVRTTGTLSDALSEKAYGKIYIMIGTNELGPETHQANSYYNNLCSLIDMIRAKQPLADIYLISIIPVSRECSEGSERFNRENILKFNEMMMQASSEKYVYYIDAFNGMIDADGYLPDNYCISDGIHLLPAAYARLKTILKTHTV